MGLEHREVTDSDTASSSDKRDLEHRRRALSMRRRDLPESPLDRFRAMWNLDYGRLWGIGVATNVMRWLETVALGVFVFGLTGSPFLVGLIGFLRMAPMLFLGVFIGALADRANRKLMLAFSNSSLCLIYIVLAFLTITELIELWHVAIGAFLAGTVWATDFPVRRAMVADVVPANRVASAFGIDMASSNFSRVIGPLAGGAFLQEIGMQAVYLLGAVLFLTASLLALTVRTAPRRNSGASIPGTDRNGVTNEASGSVLNDLRSGLAAVRGDVVLSVTLIVTVWMNLFAFPYQHMIPVIGSEKLGVSPILVGLLLSAEGLGATIGALSIAALARPRHFTRAYIYASLGFLAIIAAFSLAPWYWIAIPLLFIGGFGMSGFGAMQSIIVVSSTRPEMRGRVLGVLAVAIGSGPIGALQVGWLASYLGADRAILIIAIVGLALTVVTVLMFRRYLVSIPRYRRGASI